MNHDLKLKNDKTQEREADLFACQLLMPIEVIRELQRRGIRITVPFLVDNFGVSNEAADIRLQYLSTEFSTFNNDDDFSEMMLISFKPFFQKFSTRYRSDELEEEWEQQKIRDSWTHY